LEVLTTGAGLHVGYDDRHAEAVEEAYEFSTPDQLMADFQADVLRWNHENGRS
jgi:hypothetical protein